LIKEPKKESWERYSEGFEPGKTIPNEFDDEEEIEWDMEPSNDNF